MESQNKIVVGGLIVLGICVLVFVLWYFLKGTPVTPPVLSTVLQNTNLPRQDYKNIPKTPDYQTCLNACVNDPKCAAWTYAPQGTIINDVDLSQYCYLKNSVPTPVTYPKLVSGVKIFHNDVLPSTTLPNTNLNGSDYQHIQPVANYQSCLTACVKDPKCLAWTYAPNSFANAAAHGCWLKNTVPKPTSVPLLVSGVKITNPT